MHRAALILLAALVSGPASAAQPEPIDDLQRLFIEDTVALIHPPSAEAGLRAKALMAAAARVRARSDFAQMRRLLAEARVVLAGGTWDADAQYLAALAPQPRHVVFDPTQPNEVRVALSYPAKPAAPAEVQPVYRAHAAAAGSAPVEYDRAADLPDGAYDLVLRVTRGGTTIGTSGSVRVFARRGVADDLARIAGRSSRLKLSPALAASLAWPGNLAATLDDRSRQAADFDWPAMLGRTEALLAEAEAGRNPLASAKGLQERHYASKVSHRIEPYKLFIPEAWDGKTALPLVVMLHGSNGDHNRPFASGRAVDQARARGWAVLAPMGYSPNSGWGNHMPVVLANGTMPEPRPSTIAGKVLPRNGVSPEPAEMDVLDALADVQAHYPIDKRRIYLAGNSMGGEGTWYLGERHPRLWAAIAPGAGAIDPAGYPYRRLGKLPVMAVHGDADPIISFAASADMISRLNKAGGKGELLRVSGGGHSSFDTVLPQIFDFFAKQERTP